MYIAVDFDGTCVTHEYPEVGKNIGAESVLKKLIEKGHKIILYTMRSGQELLDAQKWFEDNDIELYASNTNPTQKFWTKSPKVYAHVYIDDAALGCPLHMNEAVSQRPFVDWSKVHEWLINQGAL